MFTYTPTYSVQQSGPRTRILVTETTGASPVTSTLVTVDDTVAGPLLAELTRLRDRRGLYVHAAATAAPGEPCMLRRAALAGFDGHRGAEAIEPIHAAAAVLADAERRAVRDEIGRLLDGSETIPVVVDLCDEFGGILISTFANASLSAADDGDIVSIAEGGDHLYETLLADLRADDDIDELCDGSWVDVYIDDQALLAWIRQNRPAILPQLAEVYAEVAEELDAAFDDEG